MKQVNLTGISNSRWQNTPALNCLYIEQAVNAVTTAISQRDLDILDASGWLPDNQEAANYIDGTHYSNAATTKISEIILSHLIGSGALSMKTRPDITYQHCD